MPTPKAGYTNKAGERIPSCTTVLGALTGGKNDPLLHWAAKLARQGLNWESERERAADVGTFIHDCLEHFPDPMPERPLWMNEAEWAKARTAYAEYAAWEAAIRPEVVLSEVQLVSEELQAGGTPDQVLLIGRDLVIEDHKTGKTIDLPKVAAQLAFYAHTAFEMKLVEEPIRRGLILHYTPKLKPIELSAAQLAAGLTLFKTARRAYQQFKEFPRKAA